MCEFLQQYIISIIKDSKRKMQGAKLRWNNSILQKDQSSILNQSSTQEKSFCKFKKYDSTQKIKETKVEEFKLVAKLKQSYSGSLKSKQSDIKKSNMACDIKKIKKIVKGVSLQIKNNGQNNYLIETIKILEEAKRILNSAHDLFDQMKQLFSSLNNTFTSSITNYLSKKKGFICLNNIRKTQSIDLPNKSEISDKQTILTEELKGQINFSQMSQNLNKDKNEAFPLNIIQNTIQNNTKSSHFSHPQFNTNKSLIEFDNNLTTRVKASRQTSLQTERFTSALDKMKTYLKSKQKSQII